MTGNLWGTMAGSPPPDWQEQENTRKIEEMSKLLKELKPLLQRTQACLAHERVVKQMERVLSTEVRAVKLGPYDMKVHVVDWVGEDEYFLGDEKLVQALCDIADEYGPEIARELLGKVCRFGKSTGES